MRPAFRIVAAGADITEKIRQSLVSIRVTDKAGMEADQVEITLSDPYGRLLALPSKGGSLSVSLGWEGHGLVDKGAFTVDEVGEDGPPDVIVIVARSADFRGSLKDAREAAYDNTTVGAILATIAARQGLTPAVHADLAKIPIQHRDQTNESDANFITRLGEDFGAIATVKSGRLLFVPAKRGRTASGGMLPAVRIARGDGDRHSFRAVDRDGSQTGVQARWHDKEEGETYFALAGKEGSLKTLKKTYPTKAEAEAAAKAAWAKQKSQAHELSLSLALGRADLLAGAPLILSGWRPEITSLTWVAGDVTHTLAADGGFTTEVPATEITGE